MWTGLWEAIFANLALAPIVNAFMSILKALLGIE